MLVMLSLPCASHGLRWAMALVCSTLLLAGVGCGSDDQVDGTPASEPTQTVESLPVDSAADTSEPGDFIAPQVATFEVAGRETFKILLESQDLVDQAADQLSGAADSQFPVGEVVRDDPGVNAPWSWHIDPGTVVFTRNAIEVCDGVPSFVEDRTITSDQYCPWSAVLIDLTPA